MWAWLRSPRGSTATATAVAVVLALFWLMPWSKPLTRLPGLLDGGEPDRPAGTSLRAVPAEPPQSPASQPVVATPGTRPQASADPSAPIGVPADSPAAAAAPTPDQPVAGPENAEAQAQLPAFDVVRVEPSGAAVIAGRAQPGSVVTLMDVGREIAHATVDASGQFALLPPDLAEGSHYLTLQSGPEGQASTSKQGVAVAVGRAGTDKPLVAMLSPDGPARILSDGGPAGPLAGTASPAAIAVQAVEAAAGGRFTVSGVAKPGSQARLYLNGSFLADVKAGPDGRWAVKVEKGMRPGPYVVRADELGPGSAKVVNRAEVPFTYPAMLAGEGRKDLLAGRSGPGSSAPSTLVATGRPTLPSAAAEQPAGRTGSRPPGPGGGFAQQADAQGTTAAGSPVLAAIVSDLKTATVTRGDSLWRISRRLLGRGMNYTEIYASNASQIRDPSKIYPGQVFVLPTSQARGLPDRKVD